MESLADIVVVVVFGDELGNFHHLVFGVAHGLSGGLVSSCVCYGLLWGGASYRFCNGSELLSEPGTWRRLIVESSALRSIAALIIIVLCKGGLVLEYSIDTISSVGIINPKLTSVESSLAIEASTSSSSSTTTVAAASVFARWPCVVLGHSVVLWSVRIKEGAWCWCTRRMVLVMVSVFLFLFLLLLMKFPSFVLFVRKLLLSLRLPDVEATARNCKASRSLDLIPRPLMSLDPVDRHVLMVAVVYHQHREIECSVLLL